VTEEIAEARLAAVFALCGWTTTRQVRLGGKHVDIVAERDGVRLAIEVKLSDWRRGASQAYLNSHFFDASLIALPANPRRRVDLAFLRALNVGLIEFDEDGWTVLLPAAARSAHPSAAGYAAAAG
jgi:hypothetical protein